MQTTQFDINPNALRTAKFQTVLTVLSAIGLKWSYLYCAHKHSN